jgi:hypothetical protein
MFRVTFTLFVFQQRFNCGVNIDLNFCVGTLKIFHLSISTNARNAWPSMKPLSVCSCATCLCRVVTLCNRRMTYGFVGSLRSSLLKFLNEFRSPNILLHFIFSQR